MRRRSSCPPGLESYSGVSIIPAARRALGGEIGIAAVPYIHCPGCRLTVYGGIAYREHKECPRCGEEMSERPGPLFRSLRLDREIVDRRHRLRHGVPIAGRPKGRLVRLAFSHRRRC